MLYVCFFSRCINRAQTGDRRCVIICCNATVLRRRHELFSVRNGILFDCIIILWEVFSQISSVLNNREPIYFYDFYNIYTRIQIFIQFGNPFRVRSRPHFLLQVRPLPLGRGKMALRLSLEKSKEKLLIFTLSLKFPSLIIRLWPHLPSPAESLIDR